MSIPKQCSIQYLRHMIWLKFGHATLPLMHKGLDLCLASKNDDILQWWVRPLHLYIFSGQKVSLKGCWKWVIQWILWSLMILPWEPSSTPTSDAPWMFSNNKQVGDTRMVHYLSFEWGFSFFCVEDSWGVLWLDLFFRFIVREILMEGISRKG